jgi:hypothetical protein
MTDAVAGIFVRTVAMNKAESYRRRAAQLWKRARTSGDPRLRSFYADRAAYWQEMAAWTEDRSLRRPRLPRPRSAVAARASRIASAERN